MPVKKSTNVGIHFIDNHKPRYSPNRCNLLEK